MQTVKILYFSYDGVLDPLGQTQVLGYLRAGAPRIAAVLVSFEKPEQLTRSSAVAALRETLAAEGIMWIPLRYHRRPPVLSTLWDAMVGVWAAWRLLRRERVDLVHARSIVCGLMAYPVKWLTGLPVVLDTRALWVDDRMEFGSPLWQRLYRVAKVVEHRFLEWADALVVLSPAYRRALESQPAPRPKPISVIPTCVDLERFTPGEGGPNYHLVYCGSLGTVYWLEGMVRFFQALCRRCPQARWLVISQSDRASLHRLCQQYGLPEEAVEVYWAAPADVPGLLRQARAGIAFCRQGQSSLGRCPTKLGEYLACGLPVVMTPGVGEWGEVIAREGCGVLLPTDSDTGEFDRAVERLMRLEQEGSAITVRCRQIAERFFDLREGARRYSELYQQVLSNTQGTGR